MDAAIAALLGAAIGAGGPVLASWLQQKAQTRSERLKMAVQLGLADHEFFLDQAKAKGGAILPVAVYVSYHMDMLDALAKEAFDASAVERLEAKQSELLAALPKRN